MALSEHRAKSEEQRKRILDEKMRRARAVTNDVLNSDTFKVQLAGIPDTPEVFDHVVKNVVEAVVNPVNDYIDTLTARGYTDAAIRKITRNLATTFSLFPDDGLHEDRIKVVAEWISENPWAYESLGNYN